MTLRHLKLLVPFLLLAASYASAQAVVQFDIVSFKPPVGWEEKRTDLARSFSTANDKAGTFCMIMLMKSIPSQGNSREDFDLVWTTVVAEQFKASSKPQMGEGGPKQGWTGEAGVAPFEVQGLKGAAMLTTLTGNGKVVGVLALTNSETHTKDIESFVDGITLPQIANEVAKPVVAAADNSRLIGKWNRSSAAFPAYADPVAWGTAGYTKSRYEFRTDGTYLYTERSFRSMYQNIIIVKETGRYSISGDTLTVHPAKSSISAYKKAGGVDALGALVKTQNRELETVTYRFTFHFFEGIKEWDLVLQADSPTQRDGQFSNNTTFQKAWYFDQKYTDNDLTSIKGN